MHVFHFLAERGRRVNKLAAKSFICKKESAIIEQMEETDLLITGEGSIDAQSFMGKALSGILRRANQFHIPVLAVAGRILDRDALIRAGVSDCIEITPRNMSIEEAIVPQPWQNQEKSAPFLP